MNDRYFVELMRNCLCVLDLSRQCLAML